MASKRKDTDEQQPAGAVATAADKDAPTAEDWFAPWLHAGLIGALVESRGGTVTQIDPALTTAAEIGALSLADHPTDPAFALAEATNGGAMVGLDARTYSGATLPAPRELVDALVPADRWNQLLSAPVPVRLGIGYQLSADGAHAVVVLAARLVTPRRPRTAKR